MSHTVTSPDSNAPSPTSCPIFVREKVTVRSARTAQPRMAPVSASTPEAMSAATIPAGLSFIHWMAAAKAESGATSRLRPTPNTASTHTWAPMVHRRWSPLSGSKGSSSTPHSLSRPVISRASGVRRS